MALRKPESNLKWTVSMAQHKSHATYQKQTYVLQRKQSLYAKV